MGGIGVLDDAIWLVGVVRGIEFFGKMILADGCASEVAPLCDLLAVEASG